MILSRIKSESATSSGAKSSAKKLTTDFEDYIINRDYSGARTLLTFKESSSSKKQLIQEWIAYCSFHLGDYEKSLEQYRKIAEMDPDNKDIDINVAMCMFYLGMYTESQSVIENIPNSSVKTRLLFHLCNKLNDQDRMMELHNSLCDITEDQLSLAGMHYLRANYQEAIDIYKRVLLDKKELLALNVYVALCYYKLDYYDISQEVLDLYLTKHSNSIIAVNLKACNRFRLFNGEAAEMEIKFFTDNETFGVDLIRHNTVVFQNGDGALQVLPSLIDIIPESRYNLTIYYLRQREIKKAEELMENVQPTISYEYILKGIVHAILGQQTRSKEHLKNAQQYLHLVGGSTTECDTIPGRQSMASAFFLHGQFEEVLVYLNSIRSYFINDDVFQYNYAQAKEATGYYKEAEEILVKLNHPSIINQHSYFMVLAKCHIYSGHAEQAWNIYVNRDTNEESFILLQLIANECYKIGEFWVAAKAFDMLEKLDQNPEYWEGKRGACAGSLYAYIAQKTVGIPPSGIPSICSLLRDSNNSQAESMLRSIHRYVSDIK